MLISSFANGSCIPESWVCCLLSGLHCSNIRVYAIWNVLVPTAPLWGQGSSLTAFDGREVTAQRHKCVRALHLCWAEQEASMQGVGWGGMGRDGMDHSPAGPLLPLSTTRCPFAGTAVLGAEHENELSCLLPCRNSNSLCSCSPSRAVRGRQRIRLRHPLPASTAGLLSSPPGATLHHGCLCVRYTHSRPLTSAGCR